MTDEPEIERCVCGAEPAIAGGVRVWYVCCTRRDVSCWSGSSHTTLEAAITAWNTLMRAAKERARLLEEVAAAHETIVGEWGGVDTLSGEYSGKYAFAHCTCPDCTEHRAREIERTAADRMTTTEESVE